MAKRLVTYFSASGTTKKIGIMNGVKLEKIKESLN